MLDHLAAGDVVTVTRIDRLARSTFDLFAISAGSSYPGGPSGSSVRRPEEDAQEPS
jgi:Resolvase, N terminal domain